MKPATLTFLALGFLAGCGTPKQAGPIPGQSQARVVVFSYKDPMASAPMSFRLKGAFGIVLRHDLASVPPSSVTYELFSEQSGRLLSTQDRLELRKALEALPASAKVDFYDTCTVSLSSEEEKSVLRWCDELRIAGVYYVMCTDFGSIGKSRPWRWMREAQQ